MRNYGNDVIEKSAECLRPHYIPSVDYSGDTVVALLSARLLLYTEAYFNGTYLLLEPEEMDQKEVREVKGERPPTKRQRRAKEIKRKRLLDLEGPYVDGFADKYHLDRQGRTWVGAFKNELGIQPSEWIVSTNTTTNCMYFRRLLVKKVKDLENKILSQDFPIFRNIKRFVKIVGFSKAVEKVLLLYCLSVTGSGIVHQILHNLAWNANKLNTEKLLKNLLEFSEEQIEELKDAEGKLAKSSMLIIHWGALLQGESHFLSCDFSNSLVYRWSEKDRTPKELTKDFFSYEPRSRLGEANFSYMEDTLSLVVDFLKKASATHLKGANILLYGPPGTGKTEMARVAAKAASQSLYHTRDSSESTGTDFHRYQMAQIILDRTKAACTLLMDEAEDFFNRTEHVSMKESPRQSLSKYRFNKTFEENAVPTIWITNSLHRIDPAHLRRFDLVVEVPIPPREVRAKIFRKYTKGLRLSSAWINETAQNVHLTPADIESAAKVIKTAGDRREKKAEKEMAVVLEEKLKVRGEKLAKSWKQETRYDITLSPTDIPLPPFVEGLKKTNSGRVCLYGPPGTGKTAFAHYLANELGKPLMAKKASDLLSMWLGQTEQFIAEMFERAELDDAVLLLDEADSFLQDRTGAHRSWEITQVNEMLVQMEHFEGVFLCSSNLMERLDQATFRRFDLKIRFLWMQQNQKVRMLSQLTDRAPNRSTINRLGQLTKLTPGDFVAVKRRFSILQDDNPDPGKIVYELEEELRFKTGSSKLVGFRS